MMALNAIVTDTSDMTPNEVSEEVSRSFGLVINEGGLIYCAQQNIVTLRPGHIIFRQAG